MGKRNLGPVSALYPSLTTIVSAVVDGRPNFLAVAHIGIMNHGRPQYISIGSNKRHYTNGGIREHGEFGVNIPGEDLMVRTDYAGLVSGRDVDKSDLFDVFYGELRNAPLIRECPVCLACRLERIVDFPTHDVFVGEITAVYADEDVLREDGGIDIARVRPLLFDMASSSYWRLGGVAGRCREAGKALKTGRKDG